MAAKYFCTRCGNDKSEGCGLPDYKVPVTYADGRTEMVTTACPLELKSGFRRWLHRNLGILLA